MRAALAALLVAGCTGAPAPRVEHPRSDEERAREPAATLAIAPITLSIGGQPVMSLGADGRLAHARCEGTIDAHGTVRDRSGATTMQLVSPGSLVDRDGRELFTLEDAALVRPSGGAARLEGSRVVFEGSPDLAIDVERGEGAGERLVLLVVAALSICEP